MFHCRRRAPDLGVAPDPQVPLPPDLRGPEDLQPGIGHNSGDPTPLDSPAASLPELPTQTPFAPSDPAPQTPAQPLSVTARNLFIKAAVRWLARGLVLAAAPELAPYLIALQVDYWAATECWPYIRAYFDPPKTLEELQADALTPKKSYEIHHFVEQG